MRNLYVLAAALDRIEESLCQPIRLEELAKACYSSPSGLQKLFRYVFQCSVSEYVGKRRLSRASKALADTSGTILEIALAFEYGSPEAFSRAFKRFWGVSPSQFRRERRFTELFPRFELEYEGGYKMPGRRRVDIGELYDVLKDLRDTYVLCVDVRHLAEINAEYGVAAGDLVIAEAAARIDRETEPEMLMFRVGGDEFAVVTGYTEKSKVEQLRKRIAARNGEMILAEGHEIPVATRFGICKIPEGNLRYNELYKAINKALEQ